LLVGQIRQQLPAQRGGDARYLPENGARRIGEVDALDAAVLPGGMALDQPLLLEPVEHAHEGRSLDAEQLSEVALRDRPGAGQMQKHQPARLRQPGLPQPLVEALAPLSVHAPELDRELLADIHTDSFLSNRLLSVARV